MKPNGGAAWCPLCLILASFACGSLATIGAAAAWLLPAEAVDRKMAFGELVRLANEAWTNGPARSAGLAMTAWALALSAWLASVSIFESLGLMRQKWLRITCLGSLLVGALPALAGCFLGFGLLIGRLGSARPVDTELLAEGAYSTIGVMFAWAAAACAVVAGRSRSEVGCAR